MFLIPRLPVDYLVTTFFFFFHCAFSHLMLIQKPLTAERRSLSEREVLSFENAEKQHLVQTAEGEVVRVSCCSGKSQVC